MGKFFNFGCIPFGSAAESAARTATIDCVHATEDARKAIQDMKDVLLPTEEAIENKADKDALEALARRVQELESKDVKIKPIKVSLEDLNLFDNRAYVLETYGSEEVEGWVTQGGRSVGRFYHHIDCSSNKGVVQVLISNYSVEEDGTIEGAAMATSDIKQTTICERKCPRNGTWSKWTVIA